MINEIRNPMIKNGIMMRYKETPDACMAIISLCWAMVLKEKDTAIRTEIGIVSTIAYGI
jgi:hypothetical protein